MNKLDSHPPLVYQASAQSLVSTFQPNAVSTDLGAAHRLLVLLPADIDISAVARRIWELARATVLQVQLLSLCKDPDEEPALRRRLVTLASLVQDDKTRAGVHVRHGSNWVDAVKSIYESGDVIVCLADQHAGLLHKPLSQVLGSSFNATVYILSGLTRPKSAEVFEIGAWLGFMGIIIGFGLLQANIIQLQEGWLQSLLLILSTFSEFWLIWVWNNRAR